MSDSKAEKEREMSTFREELLSLINSHSMENGSNTPDFILAVYLSACLAAYETAITNRDKWFNYDPWCPPKEREEAA